MLPLQVRPPPWDPTAFLFRGWLTRKQERPGPQHFLWTCFQGPSHFRHSQGRPESSSPSPGGRSCPGQAGGAQTPDSRGSFLPPPYPAPACPCPKPFPGPTDRKLPRHCAGLSRDCAAAEVAKVGWGHPGTSYPTLQLSFPPSAYSGEGPEIPPASVSRSSNTDPQLCVQPSAWTSR